MYDTGWGSVQVRYSSFIRQMNYAGCDLHDTALAPQHLITAHIRRRRDLLNHGSYTISHNAKYLTPAGSVRYTALAQYTS